MSKYSDMILNIVLREGYHPTAEQVFMEMRRHDHAFCVGCGELCDVEMRDMTPDIEKSFGQPVISYVLRINYLCENCRKKADEKL